MACLGITVAIRTSPTAALEIILEPPPLHLQLEAEARAGIYRLLCSDLLKPGSNKFGHVHISQDMEKEPIIQMGSEKIFLKYVYEKPFTVRFLDRSEWEDGFQPDRKCGLIWYTDGSKTNKSTRAGVHCYGTGWKLRYGLWRYTRVFQVEVYAMEACIMENLDRNYRNRNIYILSDSQSALKALDRQQINSKLVWDCHQTLMELAKHKRVQLMWVPGDEGIARNETADQLAKIDAEYPSIGLEPSCGISIGVAKKAIRDWTMVNHKKYWRSLTGLKKANRFIQGTSAKNERTVEAE
jgi:ribonuclease HI